MKIGIDISPMQYAGTGVARYTKALVEHLIALDREDQFSLFYGSFGNIFAAEKLEETAKKQKNVKVKSFPIPEFLLHLLWNDKQVLAVDRLIGKQDVFFYSDWLMPPFKGKKITTVHDLVFRKYPETVDPYVLKTQQKRFERITKESFFVLCDSRSTQQDLLQFYPIKKSNTRVIYPGVTTLPQDAAYRNQVRRELGLEKPYILAVGKKEPRKNLPRLIEAFTVLKRKDIELVIVGPQGWGEVSPAENVRNIPFIDDRKLYALYQEALFFAMPSLYEGFGFPLIEAMSLGCPTTCSDNSSLSEIADGASLLFDPLDVLSISKALSRMITDGKMRNKLMFLGKKQAAKFNWDTTAKEVLEVIKEIA